MSGRETGARAAALRAVLATAAVPYSLANTLRNRAFEVGLRKAVRLPRPVISIGNITTGGTGKTPVVRWLAERLRASGESVAVLSRGYKAAPGKHGDEQQMLSNLLNEGAQNSVVFQSNPSRFLAGRAALQVHPEIGVFLLDDGFQHRQLARDFDLVLINAAEPFGFGRVLPRGLLRESLRGLSRASAFLLTRCDQVSSEEREEIGKVIRKYNSTAPIYESVHALTDFRNLNGLRAFAFCGLGDPESFIRLLSSNGCAPAGHRFFPDHHPYTDDDVRTLHADAATAGADVFVTTEKDWVKLRNLASVRESKLPIHRVDVTVQFQGDDETLLFAQVEGAIKTARQAGSVGSV
jgi:tetraacyldisaccharide 4'-kinase